MARASRPAGADFEPELRRLLGSQAPAMSAALLERLERLDKLLLRWSSKVDLFGFATAEERIRRYFAEPLAAVRWLPPRLESALDVGSGGGSPALPLALWSEPCRWRLVESRARKALFLEEAARSLGLAGVRVSRERFEGGRGGGDPVDLVTTRGVRLGTAELSALVARVRPEGRFLWFSGESRLREGRDALAHENVTLFGPVPLLQGFPGSLLVVGKPPAGSEGQESCFT